MVAYSIVKKIALLCLISLVLVGCGSIGDELIHGTSYHPSTQLNGGYSETNLAPDIVRIVFRGNSSTSKERAQDIAMLRASDLSLQAGFPYFEVLKELDEMISNDVEAAKTDTPVIHAPRIEMMVHFLKEKPTGTVVFDSTYLMSSLKLKYGFK